MTFSLSSLFVPLPPALQSCLLYLSLPPFLLSLVDGCIGPSAKGDEVDTDLIWARLLSFRERGLAPLSVDSLLHRSTHTLYLGSCTYSNNVSFVYLIVCLCIHQVPNECRMWRGGGRGRGEYVCIAWPRVKPRLLHPGCQTDRLRPVRHNTHPTPCSIAIEL